MFKKYKIHIITATVALVAVFFLTGVVKIARNGVEDLWDSVIAATNPPAYGGSDCTQAKAVQDLSGVSLNYSGSKGTASIKNNSDHCTYRVILGSYSAIMAPQPDFQKFVDTQKLFDKDIKEVKPGQTASFEVKLDTCTIWQMDLFFGPDAPVPPDFDHLSGYHNFDSRVDGELNACNQTPTNTPVTGYVDSYNNAQCIVNGWAADPDDKTRDVQVKVYADGQLKKTLSASHYRSDLEGAGVCGDGKCAWGDGFSDVLEQGKTYRITVKAIDLQDGKEYELHGSGKDLTCGVPQVPPDDCTLADAREDISIVPISISGNRATARATNNSSSCTHRMGLASYQAYMSASPDFQRFVDTQTLFRQDMKNLAPGQSANFSVEIPTCLYWQVDFFAAKPGLNAPVPPDFVHLADYHNFDAKLGGTGNSCDVTPDDLQVVCVASDDNVRMPDPVTFTANATGGSGNYTYSWSGYVTGNTKSVTKNTSPGSTGFKTATVTVTSGGQTKSASCNITVYREVDPPNPLTGSCVASPNPANIGQNVTWTANASGGSGNYTYSWSGDANGTSRTVSRSYTTSGTKSATVTITSGSESITRNCSVLINQDIPPLTGSCQGIPSQANIGQTVTWSASASGGSGNYSYSWSGAVTGSGSSRTATYNTPGVKTATVDITSGGNSISRTCEITVVPDNNPLGGSCQGTPSSARTGETITWTANGTGGNGNYTYSWTGAVTGTGSSRTATYDTTGTKTATVTITSGNESVTRNCEVNITPRPVTLTGTCEASPSNVRRGQNVTWTANASGGSGNYTYSWTGAASGTSRTVTTSYDSTGTKNSSVTINDGANSVTASCSVRVESVSLDVSCYSRSSSYEVGDTVRWSANASGGDGNYEYEWEGTNGLEGDERTVTKRYNSDGTKTARVTVRSAGETATARCQVDIDDEPRRTPSLDVSCTADPQNATVGQEVTWRANARGGDGDYDYFWSGTDNLSSNSSSVRKTYNTPGYKNSTVTVRSDNQTVSATCSTLVSQQSVFLSQLPLPNPTPLSYVYLNQVPYTGIIDDMSTAGRMLMLLLWSAAITFVGIKFWNSRSELAYVAATEGESDGGLMSKFKNILASIIPGAFASPYMEEVEVEGGATDEGAVADEEDEEEDESDNEEELEVRDIEALMNLSISKKAIVSRQALKSVYNEFGQNFEEASLELMRIIDNAALTYPREDGWMILNSERLESLR